MPKKIQNNFVKLLPPGGLQISANLLSNIQTLINQNLDIFQTFINLSQRLSTFINVYCGKGASHRRTPSLPVWPLSTFAVVWDTYIQGSPTQMFAFTQTGMPWECIRTNFHIISRCSVQLVQNEKNDWAHEYVAHDHGYFLDSNKDVDWVVYGECLWS